MNITTNVLDIEAYEDRKCQPAAMMPRDSKIWITREMPLLVEAQGDWGWCREGDIVRIPLFPYMSRGHDPAIAIGFAFELGYLARDTVDPRYDVERLHIALGHPVCDHKLPDGHETLRFWLGFGFVLKEK
jgi:hypothetical protein